MEKISILINIKLDSGPANGYSYKHMKTKIKMYVDRVNRNFQLKRIPKENISCKIYH